MINFVPEGFVPPRKYESGGFVFLPLSPEFAEADFAAVKTAREHIRALYKITGPLEWPTKNLSFEEDKADLIRHYDDFCESRAFAYTVLSEDEKTCLGCVYIDPSENPDYDAEITLWGLNAEISKMLYKTVKEFLRAFPFKNPAFPVFEIPLSVWGKVY